MLFLILLIGCDSKSDIKIFDINNNSDGTTSFTLINESEKTIKDIIVVFKHIPLHESEFLEEVEISSIPPNTPKKYKTKESSFITEFIKIK